MPSQRDPQEPQDPMEDEDLVGAGEDDAEEADEEEEDDDILDEEDDELDEELDDEAEEETDDEPVASEGGREALTGEVGSEGGSPGETVLRRSARAGLGRGSEATSTWEGGRDDTPELKDEDSVPAKRAP